MTESIRLPDVDDEVNATLSRLLVQLRQKTTRNLLRASYYDGKRAIRDVGTVIPPTYFRLGLVLGWTAKAVDALVRRCRLEQMVWPDGDLDQIGIGELWEANSLDSEIPQALTSSLIHATVFAITTTSGDDRGLLHFKNALNATGEWDPRTRRLKNLLSITSYDQLGQPDSLVLYLDGKTITASRDGGWRVEDVQEHPWGVPAEPLVYRPRLGRWAGSSRISRPLMSLQDQAVRELIRLEGHMDVYSWPELWMLGADETIFRNPDGSPRGRFEVMIGRIKGIPDDDDAIEPRADVKQFPAASPDPHIKGLNAFAKLFAREASLPDSALAIEEMANPTSAESYAASREELISEAEGATDDWSPALRRAIARTLAVQNGLDEIPGEWRTIAPKWRSPMYLSRAAEADAGAKTIGAVPWLAETEVGLEKLGFTRQEIDRAVAERRRAEAAARTSRLLDAAERATGDPQVAGLVTRRGVG